MGAVIDLESPPAPLQRWTIVCAAWGVAVAALAAWLLRTPVATLRGQLQALQFWSLEACVFVGLAFAAAVLHELARTLDRRDLFGAVALGALGVALTLTLPPRTNRIFYDEQIYQNVARNLADSKRAQLCDAGAIRDGRLRCDVAEYNKQPYAFPHVLSLAYRALGVRPAIPFLVNAAAAGLAAACLYLTVVALFFDRIAAAGAALCLALTPEQLVWSSSGAAEPSASLACIAALLAAACFVRLRTSSSLAGAAIAAAYAVQFRPESILIVPVVVLLLWQRARDEFRVPRFWWAALLFLACAFVHTGHMAAVRTEGWGTTEARMSLAYAAHNLRVNGRFFLWDARFPPLFTLLAAVGLAAQRSEAGKSTLVVYVLSFFGVALLFYAGSYDYGADVRYSVATYPPLMMLAGLGAARLVSSAGRWIPHAAASAMLALAVVGHLAWSYLPVVRSTDDSAWAARADVEFARSFAATLPRDAYVLTHNPGMFHVWGVNAGQMAFATRAGFVDDVAARFGGGVYLHWNFWCNTQDRSQQALCAQIRDRGPVEEVRDSRVRDQHFVFYRMIFMRPRASEALTAHPNDAITRPLMPTWRAALQPLLLHIPATRSARSAVEPDEN